MKVEFLEKFNKDLDSVKDQKVKIALQKVILKLETAESLSEIHNLKKLKGHPIAWRIRIGDYRLGLFAENQVLELARFVHRKGIYKVFP